MRIRPTPGNWAVVLRHLSTWGVYSTMLDHAIVVVEWPFFVPEDTGVFRLFPTEEMANRAARRYESHRWLIHSRCEGCFGAQGRDMPL